jgi:hypothetical protein
VRDDPAPDASVGVSTTAAVTLPVIVTRPAVTTPPTALETVPPLTAVATEEPTTAPTTAPTPSQCAVGDWQMRADAFAANIAAQGDSNGLEIVSVTGDAGAVIRRPVLAKIGTVETCTGDPVWHPRSPSSAPRPTRAIYIC